VLTIAIAPAKAQDRVICDTQGDILGTQRLLVVNPEIMPRVGRKHFLESLPLARKEIVLTFDDGPWPKTTLSILNTLKRECVRATFFVLGRNALAYPEIARREIEDGHTVAHHTFAHPLLNRMQFDVAKTEIEHGFAAVDAVLYGKAAARPATPFFRFPGFASSPPLLKYFEDRKITVFDADLWASDWIPMSADEQQRVVFRRIEQVGGGIVLFHDTKRQTAAMLPKLLRQLKNSGYRTVHVVANAVPPE
jgi:peptidoglycan/xylan/chitin deacetylase (PgdA/CDA1 family)